MNLRSKIVFSIVAMMHLAGCRTPQNSEVKETSDSNGSANPVLEFDLPNGTDALFKIKNQGGETVGFLLDFKKIQLIDGRVFDLTDSNIGADGFSFIGALSTGSQIVWMTTPMDPAADGALTTSKIFSFDLNSGRLTKQTMRTPSTYLVNPQPSFLLDDTNFYAGIATSSFYYVLKFPRLEIENQSDGSIVDFKSQGILNSGLWGSIVQTEKSIFAYRGYAGMVVEIEKDSLRVLNAVFTDVSNANYVFVSETSLFATGCTSFEGSHVGSASRSDFYAVGKHDSLTQSDAFDGLYQLAWNEVLSLKDYRYEDNGGIRMADYFLRDGDTLTSLATNESSQQTYSLIDFSMSSPESVRVIKNFSLTDQNYKRMSLLSRIGDKITLAEIGDQKVRIFTLIR